MQMHLGPAGDFISCSASGPLCGRGHAAPAMRGVLGPWARSRAVRFECARTEGLPSADAVDPGWLGAVGSLLFNQIALMML